MDAVSLDLATYIRERNPQDLAEMTKLADQYLIAHRKQLSSGSLVPRKGLSKVRRRIK